MLQMAIQKNAEAVHLPHCDTHTLAISGQWSVISYEADLNTRILAPTHREDELLPARLER